LHQSDNGAQLQIGITTSKTKRLSRRRKGVPFGFQYHSMTSAAIERQYYKADNE